MALDGIMIHLGGPFMAKYYDDAWMLARSKLQCKLDQMRERQRKHRTFWLPHGPTFSPRINGITNSSHLNVLWAFYDKIFIYQLILLQKYKGFLFLL